MSRRLRIVAYSAVDLSLPQGHALHLRGLFDALAARGHEVVLIAPRPASPPPEVRFRCDWVRTLRWGILGPWSFELLGWFRLLSVCRRERPDLIYARQDLYTFAPGCVAKRLGLPLAVEVNALLSEEMALWGPRAAQILARISERYTLRRASSVLVLGERLARSVRERFGVAAERIRIVRIATHLPEANDPTRVRAEMEIDPGLFVVTFAGNLRLVQGIDVLIRAVRMLNAPDVRLWIIGTGAIGEELRRRAAPLRERVHFFGGVAREESDRLLLASQILVAPYMRDAYDRIAGDAISTKVLSYLASDRPVLISEMPYYEWIAEIGAGETFRSGDAEALADRLAAWRERWIEAGRPLRGWPWESPGPGRRFVEADRTWEAASGEVEAVLLGLLSGEGRPGR